MKTNPNIMIAPLIAAALLWTGCSEVNPSYTPASGAEEGGTVTGFALGADISSVTEYENNGETFYNAEGNARECTALMKEIGMNSIRLRVWVNPENGWCNKSDVLVKALRAQKLGMRLMIDFHYSDTWADPGRQLVPAAWMGYNTEEIADAVAGHTTEVLTLLKDNGVDVEWVQVGNEVTPGMIFHTDVAVNDEGGTYGTGDHEYGGSLSTHPENFAKFIDAGYGAVKEVYPDAKVIVHVDRGQLRSVAESVFDVLEANNARYDIIGLSLYPYDDEASDWATLLDRNVADCIDNISYLYGKYGHEVMIVETGMPYNMPDETYGMLTKLISGSKATEHCCGVFYWEPEAPASSGYPLGAFDNSRPTHALDAFTEAAEENLAE